MMLYNRKRNLYILLSVLWFIVILIFSAQPASISAGLSRGITKGVVVFLEKIKILPADVHLNNEFMMSFHTLMRKLAHMFEYFILAMLINTSLLLSDKKPKEVFLYTLVFVGVAASIDELFQTTIDGRAGLISDVFIDLTGGLIGIITLYIVRTLKNPVKKMNNN